MKSFKVASPVDSLSSVTYENISKFYVKLILAFLRSIVIPGW